MRRPANIYLVGNEHVLAPSVSVMIEKEGDGRTSIAFAHPAGTFTTGVFYGLDFGKGELWQIDAVVVPDNTLPVGVELISCADAQRINTSLADAARIP
jgi:hypothetical protein